jgi:hypothetical protein
MHSSSRVVGSRKADIPCGDSVYSRRAFCHVLMESEHTQDHGLACPPCSVKWTKQGMDLNVAAGFADLQEKAAVADYV